MATTESDYLTVAEAAQMLRVSKPTVWRWISAGRLRAARLGPRTVRLRRREVERLGRPPDEGKPAWEKFVVQIGDPSIPEEELMAEIQAINDAILAERGGAPFDDSLPLIHEARDERVAQL